MRVVATAFRAWLMLLACLFAAGSATHCRRPTRTEFGAIAARRSRYFRGNRTRLSGARHFLRGRLDRRARRRATPHGARDHGAGESGPSLLGRQDDLRRGVLQADNLPILLRLSAACAPDSKRQSAAGATPTRSRRRRSKAATKNRIRSIRYYMNEKAFESEIRLLFRKEFVLVVRAGTHEFFREASNGGARGTREDQSGRLPALRGIAEAEEEVEEERGKALAMKKKKRAVHTASR